MDEFKNNELEPTEDTPVVPEEVVEAVEAEVIEDAAVVEDVAEEVAEAVEEDAAPLEDVVDDVENVIGEEAEAPVEIAYDEEGNPILPEVEYDEDGNPVVPVPQFDENGNIIGEWATAELTQPQPKKNWTLPLSIIAAVIVVCGLITSLVPSIVPFNMTTKKFKTTDEYVRVQEQVLSGKDGQVVLLNGKTYVSVKGISDVFEYGAKAGNSAKVKVDGKSYKLSRNAKRVNGHKLKNRLFSYNKNVFIAYEDVPTAFATLKTAKLGEAATPCIYDPIATVKSGQTIQDLIDQYAGMMDAETIKQQLHITDDKELEMDYYVYQATMPMSKYAEMSDQALEDVFKSVGEQTGIDTSAFNGDTTYAEVQGSIPCGKMFGENLDAALEQYYLTEDALGFKVTEDTLFSEVRNVLYLGEIDMAYQQELAASSAPAVEEAKGEPAPELEEEAPAEEAEAPAEEPVAEAPAENAN